MTERDGAAAGVRSTDVAVVGMACRFPGAGTVDEFWDNLRDGVESVRTLSDEELRAAGAPPSLRRDPDHVPREGFLEDADLFDAGFFGLSPRDAAIMDPQHRQFLECAWEALEDAAHPPDRFPGPVGVFAGSGMQTYLMHNLLGHPSLMDDGGMFLVRHTGNDKDFLATRASYEFDLRGPSVSVQTACSTSLVAVHLGCESLLGGECDMALVGGVTIDVPQGQGYVHREGAIFSPDGRCRAFDADAGGTVGGSGVGVVVLRRLEDALADGDHVHAVIRGSAVNNDGAGKVGYLAPSVDGQAEAVAEALAIADVDPRTVGYVEAHGTATPMGDPIEVEALTRAFRTGPEPPGSCALGSVKTNVGHLDAAAGVAGLIKTALSLEHRKLPPSLHYREPNPEIDFDDGPFHVNASLRAWERDGSTPRRAGVNSLGVGGTNAHVVLEEAPEPARPDPARSRQLLTVSARTPEALERATDRLAGHLERHPELELPDVAYTLQAGRRRFGCRRTLVCGSVEEAAASLRERTGRFLGTRSDRESERPVAWMLSGQGAQYPGMGRELYEEEATFRRAVDRCAEILEPELGFDVRTALFPERSGTDAEDRLRDTAVTQPAVFTVEYALARLWRSFGVEPAALIGHSLGEITAACLAGVFSLEDALRLVTARGRLMGELPGGSMLAVPLAEDRLASHLDGEATVAVVNAPELSVASGPEEAVDRLEERLADEGIRGSRLRTSHAFHSAMMDPAVEAFEEAVRAADPRPPSVPLVSNVTGTWMTEEEATDPGYWARHIRETVRFADGLGTMLADTGAALLEVGPGTTLRSLARRHPGREDDRPLAASLPHPDDDAPEADVLLDALGALWRAGAEVDWDGVHGGRRRRARLPTYPFEHESYWIEPADTRRDAGRASPLVPRGGADDRLRKRERVDDWFYRPVWRSAPLPRVEETPEDGDRRVLVLADGEGIGDAVADRLADRGCTVIRAAAGPGFEEADDGDFVLDPASPDDHVRLLRRLEEDGRSPDHVVHGWSLDGRAAGTGLDAEALDDRLDRSFFSLLHLARALVEARAGDPVSVTVVSRGAQAAAGAPEDPVPASLMGPVRVMGRELPDVTCRCVDVSVPERGSWRRDRLAGRLAAEILAPAEEPVVAYRGADRLAQAFEPVDAAAGPDGPGRLRDEGVYLVTGGLGGLGRVLAEHLGRTRRARLALVSRSGLPPRETWDDWLAGHDGDDPTSRGIRTVRRIEADGGAVRVMEADVTDPEAMRRAVEETREAFGRIHGAFHLAGHLDDGLIQLTSRERAAEVLAPKVRGTVVLERALRGIVEDFVLLYSSLSAVLGPTGQVDYVAANAFQDAFAAWRSETGGTPVISVGWGTWKEGMAAASGDPSDDRASAAGGPGDRDGATPPPEDGSPSGTEEPADHPLLARRTEPSDDVVEFVGRLDPSRHWIVDEHRTRDGTPLLPGTGYLELARAAVDGDGTGGALELRDVFFTAPWAVRNGSGREIRVALRREGSGARFVVRSPAGEGRSGDEPWIEHARGTARVPDDRRPDALPLAAIRERCEDEEIVLDGALFHEGLRLGPRWHNVRRIDLGEEEALVELGLPEAYRPELEDYHLHPAILDSALGAGQALVSRGEDGEFYFPVSLDAVRVHAPLAPEVFSHLRRRGETATEDPVFDVTVTDRDGTVLVEVEGLRMRRAEGGDLLGDEERPAAGGGEERPAARGDGEGRTPRADDAAGIFELARREGITAEEGMEALERILSSLPLTHVVVSPLQLDALRRRMRASDRDAGSASDGDTGSPEGDPSHGRPSDLSASYEAPRSGLEETIAAAWEEHLGIGGIGVHDDFFELGGHSLLLSQIAARLQKDVDGEVALSRLFDEPTIAGWAELLEEAEDGSGGSSMKAVSRAPREEYRVGTS